ncbi:MAG TPA: patatin-like phospholipase family protein [Anaerolineaceae bacterium]|nr:patatin-like phospholipase family protein [Anaerolineaceae bacterium]
MKPFRKNVALSIDGGGIKGVICTRALSILEDTLGKPVHDIFRLTTGTSTGSIISAGLASGLTAKQMHQLYIDLGDAIFKKSWRTFFFPLTRYRYETDGFREMLFKYIGNGKMGDFWNASPPTDVVITSFDLVTNHTLFIKPWKEEYKDWLVVDAVMASSNVPTYFPVVQGRYVDGGVGAYANPCYLAAYEIVNCLQWDPAETTLISLGTGRNPHQFAAGEGANFYAWDWIGPIMGAFLQCADDQQVHLVDTFFPTLDFRRFQVDLQQSFEMDDPSKIPQLIAYGEQMGNMILNDATDPIQTQVAKVAPPTAGITQ